MIRRLAPVTLQLLQIFAAFIFFQLGSQKVFGLFGGAQAEALTFAWISGVLELAGGIILAAGMFSRFVAVVLAADMAAIYLSQHLVDGILPVASNRLAEEVVLLFLVAGLLVFSGPGQFRTGDVLQRIRGHRWSRYYPNALAAVRIVGGMIFMTHGLQKLFGIGGNPQPLWSLRWFGGILEVFGGAAIVIGLFTVPVAFVLSGQMAVAYFISHFPRGFFPAQNGGIRAVVFCFMFLYLWTAGGGSFSLDRVLARRRESFGERATEGAHT